MMEGIRHIIFDLGGVILNIDYRLTQQAFEQLGLKNGGEFYSKQRQHKIFDLLETGKIGEEEFLATVQNVLPGRLQYGEITEAWNAMILDFPLRRLQILQQLQLHYDLFLLSNTNVIHERAYNRVLQLTCGYPSLSVFFDKIYLSHRVGLRKPDVRIFKLVMDENRLKPEQTLFIDDSIQHIESAKSLGIQTIHMLDEMTMENDIFKIKESG